MVMSYVIIRVALPAFRIQVEKDAVAGKAKGRVSELMLSKMGRLSQRVKSGLK
jgi:hypothetical protein